MYDLSSKPRAAILGNMAAIAFLAAACSSRGVDAKPQSTRADASVGDAATQSESSMLTDGAAAAASDATASGPAAQSGVPTPSAHGSSAAAGAHAAAESGKPMSSAHGADAGADHAEELDSGAPASTPPSKPVCSSCGDCEETQKIGSNMHTTMPVKYDDPPPTSGPHNPCWASWGVHDTQTPPERWVHNLEHGGVVCLYNCPSGCPDDVAKLTALVKAHKRTLLTAYDALPARFAVVSAGHRLVTNCLDEQAFAQFYAANFNHATESNDNNPNPGCPP
jgi:hypothetical protein